jgi:hypothetical protein
VKKYVLSAPQKVLLGLMIFVATLTVLTIAGLTWWQWSNNQPKPILITASDNAVLDAQAKPITSLDYGEEFQVVAEHAVIKWQNNQLIVLSGSKGIVTKNLIQISQGKALVFINSTNQPWQIQSSAISTNDLVALIDISRTSIDVFAGKLIAGANTLGKDEELNLTHNSVAGKFNRRLLVTDTQVSRLREIAVSAGLAPSNLADVVAPQLSSIQPRNGSTVTQASVTITGTLDDANASTTVNNTQVAVSNGTFSFNVDLRVGDNVFILQFTDSVGNVNQTELVYKYTPVDGETQTTPSNNSNATEN